MFAYTEKDGQVSLSYKRPYFDRLDEILKVANEKKLLCKISDELLAGVAVLVS